MKKIIYRVLVFLILGVYCIFVLPNQVNLLTSYLKLSDEKAVINSEIAAMSKSLPKAKDVYDSFTLLEKDILMCNVVDYSDSGVPSLKSYSGEDLESSPNRIIEFVVDGTTNLNTLFSGLGTYDYAYESITADKSGEILIRIFCK